MNFLFEQVPQLPYFVCLKTSYGPYESENIMKNIKSLILNYWIEGCFGTWGSNIVLGKNPYQEHINNIKDFIWRMYVSYHKRNNITKYFEYSVPRCEDSVTVVFTILYVMYIITIDAHKGYQQISIRKLDRETLSSLYLIIKILHLKSCLLDQQTHRHFYLCYRILQ